jgi:hypothetical protein
MRVWSSFDEVVGRKDGNDRVGIARVDPVRR